MIYCKLCYSVFYIHGLMVRTHMHTLYMIVVLCSISIIYVLTL